MTTYIADAEAPSRSVGTVTLSWGLVNMSLSLYTSTEDMSLGRKEFIDGDPTRPAGRAVIDKETKEQIDSSRVVRMAEADSGAWVSVTDDEIAATVGAKNVAEILAFVIEETAHEAYVRMDYHQVRPHKTKGVMDPASAKAFALFLQVLEERGLVALVRVATRGPLRYALINRFGDFTYVRSTDEVRKSIPWDKPQVDAAHLKVANDLVDAIGIGTPHLPNATAQAVKVLVNAKAAGAILEVPVERPATPEVNIFDVSSASITARKASPSGWAPPVGAPVEKEKVA